MAGQNGIPLADAIGVLRAELVEAMRSGEGEDIAFALGPVELELGVEATGKVEGQTGIKFWLVSLGATGSRSSGTTHTVKLTLTPVRRSASSGEAEDVLLTSELGVRG